MVKSCNCLTLVATLAILAVFFLACQIFLFTPDWAPITALARYNRSWLRHRRPECKVTSTFLKSTIYTLCLQILHYNNLTFTRPYPPLCDLGGLCRIICGGDKLKSSFPFSQAILDSTNLPRTIAVVGNGPLSDLQRSQVEMSDVVIRFNKLNNR